MAYLTKDVIEFSCVYDVLVLFASILVITKDEGNSLAQLTVFLSVSIDMCTGCQYALFCCMKQSDRGSRDMKYSVPRQAS